MTTRNQNHNVEDEDIIPEDLPSKDVPIEDAVAILLAPYEPAESESEADQLFSTSEIIAALERHYGVPQGSTFFVTIHAGVKVVHRLTELGFKYVNTGPLQLQWIFKKKT